MMREKKRAYGIFCFLSGILFASAVMFFVLTVPRADADSGFDCMKSVLKAYGYSKKIPSPTIDIVYDIPSCLGGYGYHMTAVSTWQGKVRVTYQSSQAKGAFSGNSGSNQVNPF